MASILDIAAQLQIGTNHGFGDARRTASQGFASREVRFANKSQHCFYSIHHQPFCRWFQWTGWNKVGIRPKSTFPAELSIRQESGQGLGLLKLCRKKLKDWLPHLLLDLSLRDPQKSSFLFLFHRYFLSLRANVVHLHFLKLDRHYKIDNKKVQSYLKEKYQNCF